MEKQNFMRTGRILGVIVILFVVIQSRVMLRSVKGQALSSAGHAVSKAEWSKLSNSERTNILEKLGRVPDFADMPRDWMLAEQTSWWGKPLNPKAFWTNRIVWLDQSAVQEARNHGRSYPPMPYEDPTLPKYRNEREFNPDEGTIEGPNLHFHWTATESAFWNKFSRTHPRPPEQITAKQLEVARSVLGTRFDLQHGDKRHRMTAHDVEVIERISIKEATEMGFPEEAFSYDSLLSAYVAKERESYETLLKQGVATNSVFVTNFVGRLVVPASFITEPGHKELIEKGNAWRRTYLKRLSQNSSNKPYVDAYLKAWDLPIDVLGSSTTNAH